MKIKVTQDLSNIKNLEDFRRFSSMTITDIISSINGNIDLIDNCDTQSIPVTFTKNGQEIGVVHTLGRIPNGYIPIKKSTPVDIYNGLTDNTSTILYVRANAAAVVSLLIF